MIDAVEDMEETLDDENPDRLPPARIEADQPRIVVKHERALGPAGRQKAKHRQDLDPRC